MSVDFTIRDYTHSRTVIRIITFIEISKINIIFQNILKEYIYQQDRVLVFNIQIPTLNIYIYRYNIFYLEIRKILI